MSDDQDFADNFHDEESRRSDDFDSADQTEKIIAFRELKNKTGQSEDCLDYD
jgi:hypothetical protein